MRILSKEFPTALFRSTAPGWVQSSAHQPLNRTISIAYHLKNFLLWIIFINIVNNYTLNFKVYLGEVDLITALSNPKPNNDTFLSQSLENILRGIYVRNEVTYLKHINETTIVAKPIFICNDNSILVILNEGFYAGEGKKLKLGNRTMVQNTFIQKFPHKSTISHFKSHIQVVQEVLEIFLNRLYDESGLDIVNVIKKLKNVIGPVTIGKLGLFVNSFVIFTLYSVFHCVPKTLLWHNINLALLYFTNTVNISFILTILISKSRLRDYSNDFSYSLLILEFISFLAVMLLFFNDHKTIMAREAILPYSCSSSVYSERNSKACDLKPDNIQPAPPLAPDLAFNPEHTADPTSDPPLSLPPPPPPPPPPPVPVTDTAPNATDANDTIIGPPPPPLQDHSTQLLPKCKSQPIFQQQPTTRPPQRYSFHIQTLQEPYITPIPLTTSVVNTQLQPATNPTIPPRNPERRCVTVPVSLPKKFDALHLGTVAGHPGHLPNLQL